MENCKNIDKWNVIFSLLTMVKCYQYCYIVKREIQMTVAEA